VALAGSALAPFTSIGANGRIVNHTARNANTIRPGTRGLITTGEHNDIAVTSQGHPVVVYFDASNQRLRMAIANSPEPVRGNQWNIVEDVLSWPNNTLDPRSFGTGQYVSIRIDTAGGDGIALDTVHISAWNTAFNSLVYIRGLVSNNTWHLQEAVFVDSVGSVGRRSTISLDAQGNPWIAYLDTAFVGGREGVKVAFLDNRPDRGTRGLDRPQTDLFGSDTTGWETMHVPARFQVVDHMDFVHSSRLGMENWPTRNFAGTTSPPTGARWWRGAVGFLSNDLFRIAYWVE